MADRVGTVSKTYAEELRYPYYAHGLSEILASRGEAFSGIVNGINMALFDPEENPNLAEHYSIKTMREGKTANKLALQQRLGLPEDKDTALLVMVTRLAGHKGIDLLCYIAERLLQRRWARARKSMNGSSPACNTASRSRLRRIWCSTLIWLIWPTRRRISTSCPPRQSRAASPSSSPCATAPCRS